MRTVKIKIKDIQWEFTIQNDKTYEKRMGKDSSGATDKGAQTVYFKRSDFSQKLVRHELFHVYYASCCTSSAHGIEAYDAEEIAAEIIEFHLKDIMKNSKIIYNALKQEMLKDEQLSEN